MCSIVPTWTGLAGPTPVRPDTSNICSIGALTSNRRSVYGNEHTFAPFGTFAPVVTTDRPAPRPSSRRGAVGEAQIERLEKIFRMRTPAYVNHGPRARVTVTVTPLEDTAHHGCAVETNDMFGTAHSGAVGAWGR